MIRHEEKKIKGGHQYDLGFVGNFVVIFGKSPCGWCIPYWSSSGFLLFFLLIFQTVYLRKFRKWKGIRNSQTTSRKKLPAAAITVNLPESHPSPFRSIFFFSKLKTRQLFWFWDTVD
jgi:hypothetical protein